MAWKYYLKGLVLCSLVPLLTSLILQVVGGCEGGFFPCSLGYQLIFAVFLLAYLPNLLVLSLVAFRPWRRADLPRRGISLWIIIMVVSLLLIAPEVPIFGSIYLGYKNFRLETARKVNYGNYNVSNFSENPIVDNTTGKYSGIAVSFALTAKKSGTYGIGIEVGDNLFSNGHIMRAFNGGQEFYLQANETKVVTIKVFPRIALTISEKPGPYLVKIIIASGQPTESERRNGFGHNQVSFDEMDGIKMETRAYQASDFDLLPPPKFMQNK